MARGRSGRIVLEVDPVMKRHLYTVLANYDLTLKEWFVSEAEKFLRKHSQLRLPLPTRPVVRRRTGTKPRR